MRQVGNDKALDYAIHFHQTGCAFKELVLQEDHGRSAGVYVLPRVFAWPETLLYHSPEGDMVDCELLGTVHISGWCVLNDPFEWYMHTLSAHGPCTQVQCKRRC